VLGKDCLTDPFFLFFSFFLFFPQASRKAATKKRAVRQTSNVFAMFDQQQIAEFKEAFSMIDHDNDGFIDAEDLKDMLSSLGTPSSSFFFLLLPWLGLTDLLLVSLIIGQTPKDEVIEEMISEAPGTINFTMFLTLMGERLSGSDPEHEILNAFESFDDSSAGFIDASKLRDLLTTMGEVFTKEEVDIMFKGAPPDAQGRFNYKEFVRVLKHGE